MKVLLIIAVAAVLIWKFGFKKDVKTVVSGGGCGGGTDGDNNDNTKFQI